MFRRFCVICGTYFESDDGFRTTCSRLCWERYEQESNQTIDAILEATVPDALTVLGLESIDEYPEWKRQQHSGSIYFVQAGEDGPIKIGFSKDVTKRVADLQIASPIPLRLLGTTEGTMQTEQELHLQFDECRLHGEWFGPNEPLVAFIGSL